MSISVRRKSDDNAGSARCHVGQDRPRERQVRETGRLQECIATTMPPRSSAIPRKLRPPRPPLSARGETRRRTSAGRNRQVRRPAMPGTGATCEPSSIRSSGPARESPIRGRGPARKAGLFLSAGLRADGPTFRSYPTPFSQAFRNRSSHSAIGGSCLSASASCLLRGWAFGLSSMCAALSNQRVMTGTVTSGWNCRP